VDRLLEDDLLRGSGADDLGEIAAVSIVPVGAAGVVQTVTEQERLETELGGLEGDDGIFAGACEIADRLVVDGGNIDGVEVSGSEQTGEGDGVAAVGLDAVAGFAWNERRGDDQTVEPLAGEMPMQDVAARTGFVDEDETSGSRLQPTDQGIDVGGSGTDAADVGDLGASIVRRVRDRDGVFVDVETDEKSGGLLHG